MDDFSIVELFLKRDQRAIAETKMKFGRRIRKIAFEITEDLCDSEECENDTYFSAWNSIPPNKPYDYLYPFLIRITRNVALNVCRRRNSKKRTANIQELTLELQSVIPDSSSNESWQDSLIEEKLNSFLSQLKDEQRNVFVRRYWYLDSISRIAEGYGLSEGKVKSILFRCRKQLHDLLKKEGLII